MVAAILTEPATAQEVLDQSFDPIGSPHPPVVKTIGPREMQAQTFTVGRAGTLSRIQVFISRSAGTEIPRGMLFDLRRTTVEGVPDQQTAPIVSQTIPASSIPTTTPAFVSVDLQAAGISVSPGQSFAIVLTSEQFTAGGGNWHGASLNSGGAFSRTRPISPPIWGPWTAANAKLGFKTYVIPAPEPPSIISQPQSQTVMAGSTVTFTVTASGTEPLIYQWYRDGAMIPSATGFTLTVEDVNLTMNGSIYTVVVTNAAGMAMSEAALLTVYSLPVISPSTAIVCTNETVTFTASASGMQPLFHQWRKNGANIRGENGSTLTISNVQVRDGGTYSVVVANSEGVVRNGQALLCLCTNSVPQLWAPDRFADALESRLTAANGVVQSENVFATKEMGEANHAGQIGAKSVWYRWEAPASGIAAFDTRGSTFDTLLAIYTGSNVSNLVAVASNDDKRPIAGALREGEFFTSEVRFNASAGATYHIAVDGFSCETGKIVLSWSLEATQDRLPTITTHPSSITVEEGAEVTFSVVASDADTYQWKFFEAPISDATNNSLTLSNVYAENVGDYSVVVSNTQFRSVESHPATLEIGSFPSLYSRDKVPLRRCPDTDGDGMADDWEVMYNFDPDNASDASGDPDGDGSSNLAEYEARTDPWDPSSVLSLSITGPKSEESTSAAPSSPSILSLLVGGGVSQILNNQNSTRQALEPAGCDAIGNASRWIPTPDIAANGMLVAHTAGSEIPTTLAAYPYIGNQVDTSTTLACSTDALRPSYIRFRAEINEEYAIHVDGVPQFAEARPFPQGVIHLHYVLCPFDRVFPTDGALTLAQGKHLVLCAGVRPANEAATIFQWYVGETAITGGVGNILILTNLQPSNSGSYRVTVNGTPRLGPVLTVIPLLITAVRINARGHWVIEHNGVGMRGKAVVQEAHVLEGPNASRTKWVDRPGGPHSSPHDAGPARGQSRFFRIRNN